MVLLGTNVVTGMLMAATWRAANKATEKTAEILDNSSAKNKTALETFEVGKRLIDGLESDLSQCRTKLKECSAQNRN